LIASAALPVGCAANRMGVGMATPAPVPTLRQPMTGQTWRYAKHDLFNGALLDTEVDRVSSVDRTIDIDSHTRVILLRIRPTQAGGASLLHHPKPAVALPTEIQTSWGTILADPHGAASGIRSPIPLWPAKLQPGGKPGIEANTNHPKAARLAVESNDEG